MFIYISDLELRICTSNMKKMGKFLIEFSRGELSRMRVILFHSPSCYGRIEKIGFELKSI